MKMEKLFFPVLCLSLLWGCNSDQEQTPVKPEPVKVAKPAPPVEKPKAPVKKAPDKILPKPEEFGKHPVVSFQTSEGTFEVTLDAEKAPKTVHTILLYCLEGFYEGTLFHRVKKGFSWSRAGAKSWERGAICAPSGQPMIPSPMS